MSRKGLAGRPLQSLQPLCLVVVGSGVPAATVFKWVWTHSINMGVKYNNETNSKPAPKANWERIIEKLSPSALLYLPIVRPWFRDEMKEILLFRFRYYHGVFRNTWYKNRIKGNVGLVPSNIVLASWDHKIHSIKARQSWFKHKLGQAHFLSEHNRGVHRPVRYLAEVVPWG